jgi:hypothetical protein
VKALRFAAPALVLVTLAGIVLYRTWRVHPVPAGDFTDDLTGPVSANLTIPFQAYAMTPEGLLRQDSASDRTYGSDRPMVKTRSAGYLARDFIFEVDVTIPADSHDIVFIGFGRGDPNPAVSMEPAAAFLFRIHNLPGMDVVHAAASKSTGSQPMHIRIEALGKYVAGTRTRFRIEKAGGQVILSMPATPVARFTFDLAAFPGLFDERSGYLFFGNSAEGTIFNHVSVRPRG